MRNKEYKYAFLIVGVILIVVSGSIMRYTYALRVASQFMTNFSQRVDAVCTKVEPVKGGDMNVISGFNAYVTYEINGKTYEDIPLEHYEVTILKGDTVSVYVSDLLPTVIRLDYPGPYYNYYIILQYVVLGVGVAFIGGHLFMVFKRRI